KSNADGVSAIVYYDGRGGRLAFQNGRSIHSNLFGSEARTRSHSRIDLKRGCRSADGVLDAVKHIDNAVNLLNGLSNARRSVREELGILREQFDDDGFRLTGEVADHVLQDLDEFHLGGRLRLLYFRTNARITMRAELPAKRKGRLRTASIARA